LKCQGLHYTAAGFLQKGSLTLTWTFAPVRRERRAAVMRIRPGRRPQKHTGRVPTEMKEHPARK
jgi:hypothetical protein